MGRKFNPAREYLEPIVTRTDKDGREYTDGPGFPMPVEAWEEEHGRRASHKSSEDMSDSGISSSMALKATLDARKVRHQAEGPRNVANVIQDVLNSKKNPTIADVLSHPINNEEPIETDIPDSDYEIIPDIYPDLDDDEKDKTETVDLKF